MVLHISHLGLLVVHALLEIPLVLVCLHLAHQEGLRECGNGGGGGEGREGEGEGRKEGMEDEECTPPHHSTPTPTAHRVKCRTWWPEAASVTRCAPWSSVSLTTRWSSYGLSLRSSGSFRGGRSSEGRGGVVRGGRSSEGREE